MGFYGMTTRIFIDRDRVAGNRNPASACRPPIKVKDSRGLRYAHEVEILGPSRIVYTRDGGICGASAWIETEAEVVLTEHEVVTHPPCCPGKEAT